MKHKLWPIILTIVLMFLVLSVVTVQGATGQDEISPQGIRAITARTTYTYTTVITVTSGLDINASKSETCSNKPVCTLRRAVVEARNLSFESDKLPVLIKFNIPPDPAEGYNSSLQVWELELKSSTDLAVFRSLKGQVIIDGVTQPGGRITGPKIILIGPATRQMDGFVVGESAGNDEIVIRGLGMQNFKTHITVNTKRNLIEDCWFGLSSDGQTLSSGDDSTPEGGSGMGLTASAEDNTIRNNKFAGFKGASVAIRGANNIFSGNWIGLRADGLVPIPSQTAQF